MTANGNTITGVTETSRGRGIGHGGRLALCHHPQCGGRAGLGNYTVSYVDGSTDGKRGGADDHGGQREQDVRADGDLRGDGVHRERAGEANGDTITGVTETSTGAPGIGADRLVSDRAERSRGNGTGQLHDQLCERQTHGQARRRSRSRRTARARHTVRQRRSPDGVHRKRAGDGNGDIDHRCDQDKHGAPASADGGGLAYAIVPSAAVGTGLGNYTISYVERHLTVRRGGADDHGGQHQQDIRSDGDVRRHGVHRKRAGEER